jgi:3D (Asp-Asp-Asp) domain-containing protein
MATTAKIEQGRAFFLRVEADLGHSLKDHIIDLFMDNAEKLGFTDDECLEVGNVIQADKGLSLTKKWWR